jgi:hypothetical protein
MIRNPEFSTPRQDVRDRFIDLLVTIAMTLLALNGWLAYAGN